MPLPLIIMGVGAAISAYGQIAQGNAQAQAASEANRMRQIEAQEIMNRLEVNRQDIYRQAEQFKVGQRGAVAASGRLTNDSTLSTLEDTNAKAVRAIHSAEIEANFQAQSLLQEGQFAQSKGQELQRAGDISAFGSLLTTAYNSSNNISTPKTQYNLNNSTSTWDLPR